MRLLLTIQMFVMTSTALAGPTEITFGGQRNEGTSAGSKLTLDLFMSYGVGFHSSNDEVQGLDVVEKSSKSISVQTSDSSVGIRFLQSAILTVDYFQSISQVEYGLTSSGSGTATSTKISAKSRITSLGVGCGVVPESGLMLKASYLFNGKQTMNSTLENDTTIFPEVAEATRGSGYALRIGYVMGARRIKFVPGLSTYKLQWGKAGASDSESATSASWITRMTTPSITIALTL